MWLKVNTVRRGDSGHVGVNRDRGSQSRRMQIKGYFPTWGVRGRAKQENQAGMTLLSLFFLVGELCLYSPRMSRV